MKRRINLRLIIFWLLLILPITSATAMAFDSGSTGGDGDLTPTVDTVLQVPPGGVFNFGMVDIPSGVTVTFTKNSANTPVTILASGDVTINGTISVNGSAGSNYGGQGGPGGYNGGHGGTNSQKGGRGGGLAAVGEGPA